MKLLTGLIVILGLTMMMGSTCMAEEATPITKLGNGLNNVLTGWIEVPEQIYEVSKEENPFVGLTYGAVKGSGYCAGRTSAGALDVGLFVFPEYDKPIVEPKHKL
jgi:putative exosortase-associated protein (TIGR04073 family)